MSEFMLVIIVSLISSAIFSIAYLYFLGLRIIRTNRSSNVRCLYMGILVCSGIPESV